MPLVVEIRVGGGWRPIGPALGSGDAPGSMSHNGPDGRQLYIFYCLGDTSRVQRSEFGSDVELVGGALRAIASGGLEMIAELDEDHPEFECWVKTDRMREMTCVRFRHVSSGA